MGLGGAIMDLGARGSPSADRTGQWGDWLSEEENADSDLTDLQIL